MNNDSNHRSPGVKGDVHRLKVNSSATAAELREFLGQMKGKRPQEALAIVAQAGLARGLAAGAALMLVLIALGTVIPFAWGKLSPVTPDSQAQAPAAAPADEDEPAEEVEADDAQPAEAAPAATADPAEADGAGDIIDRLGIGEAKEFEPGRNPLENRTDDLLKDLDN